MIRATLTSLLSRKLRLILSGLAVVLGVTFVSAAFVLTDTLNRSFDNLYAGVDRDIQVRVSAQPLPGTGDAAATTPVPAGLVRRTAAVAGVASATGVVSEDGARLIGADGKAVTTAFNRPRLGTNWLGERGPVRLRSGRGPAAAGEIAINASLARAGKVRIGDRVGVLTLQPRRVFTVVGIIGYSGDRDSLGGAQEIAFQESVAAELMLGRPGVYSAVDVRAAPGVTPAGLKDRLSTVLGGDYVIQTGDELRAAQAKTAKDDLARITQILLGVAGIALFVGIFLILNTFSILVAQRTRELALLRALGAGRRQVVGSVLLEAALIGLIASVLGLGLGVGAGVLLAWMANDVGEGGLDLSVVGVPAVAAYASFAVGLLVTMLAALVPALRASRIPPIAALREAATPDRPLTRLTISGGVIGAGGATLLVLGLAGGTEDVSLVTVFGGILVSFVGAALLTPAVARPAVSVIGRLFAWSVPGKLGRLNAGRNPRRTAITASALMVGIALVTGVNVVLTSSRASFQNQAAEYYRADLIVSGTSSTGRPETFDAAVLGRARAVPGVRAVVGQYYDIVLIGDRHTGVTAFDDDSGWRAMINLTPAAGTVGRLGPDQVLLDTDTAAARGLAIGAPVQIRFAGGQRRTLTLAATYTSEWSSGFILPSSVLPDMSIRQPSWGLIRLAPGASEAGVRRQVGALLADSPEVVVSDRAGYVDLVTGIFDTVVVLLQVLLALAMLIAALGIVNTLALSVLERTRELGLIRVVGLDRRQAMRMVTAEAMVISIFGALLGVAVGTGLGAAVVRAMRSEGISDLALPWSFLGAYLLLGAVIGVVAAVLPAIRAARINVLRAISYE
jgi:putative ABC transport system permease protein